MPSVTVRSDQSTDDPGYTQMPEYALWTAVILEHLRQARKGDQHSLAWLKRDGPPVLSMLGISTDGWTTYLDRLTSGEINPILPGTRHGRG